MKKTILLIIIIAIFCLSLYAELGTPGLVFRLIANGTAYEVSGGVSGYTNPVFLLEEIIIPPIHNRLPVTHILDLASSHFGESRGVVKIHVIPYAKRIPMEFTCH